MEVACRAPLAVPAPSLGGGDLSARVSSDLWAEVCVNRGDPGTKAGTPRAVHTASGVDLRSWQRAAPWGPGCALARTGASAPSAELGLVESTPGPRAVPVRQRHSQQSLSPILFLGDTAGGSHPFSVHLSVLMMRPLLCIPQGSGGGRCAERSQEHGLHHAALWLLLRSCFVSAGEAAASSSKNCCSVSFVLFSRLG